MFTPQCRQCQVCLELLYWQRRKQCCWRHLPPNVRTPALTGVAERTFGLPEAVTACQSSPLLMFSPRFCPDRHAQTDKKAASSVEKVSPLNCREAIPPSLHDEKERAGTQIFVSGTKKKKKKETSSSHPITLPVSPDRDSRSARAVLAREEEGKLTNNRKKRGKRKKRKEKGIAKLKPL